MRPTLMDYARRAMFSWLTEKAGKKWATEADLPVEVQSMIARTATRIAKKREQLM